MNCPYCNGKMRFGGLNSKSAFAVYWVPKSPYGDYTQPTILPFIKRDVESRGGVVLGETNMFFEKKTEPVTWYCKSCKVLITKLD